MNIFISWSGHRSKKAAAALNMWLPYIFQGEQIFMSEHDIEAGSRWGNDLNSRLESSNFGIICLTPENLTASWLLFEAGALSKAVNVARVVPYRLNLTATNVVGPLSQFQGVDADKLGTLKLLESINSARESGLSGETLLRIFEKWWPDLEEILNKIPELKGEAIPQRSDRALLEEILQLVRNQQQQLTVLDPVSFAGLSRTYDEISRMSNAELDEHRSKLLWEYVGADTQAEKHLLNMEMNRIEEELKRRLNKEGSKEKALSEQGEA